MYKTFNTKISDTLAKVKSVRKVYGYPLDESETITSYPAVIYFPDSFDNEFHDTTSNMKFYRYKMYVVVETKNTTQTEVFTDILPDVVDAVIAQFDTDWNFGTVDGHRVRALINSGIWTQSVTEKGRTAIADLNLIIKTLTS